MTCCRSQCEDLQVQILRGSAYLDDGYIVSPYLGGLLFVLLVSEACCAPPMGALLWHCVCVGFFSFCICLEIVFAQCVRLYVTFFDDLCEVLMDASVSIYRFVGPT